MRADAKCERSAFVGMPPPSTHACREERDRKTRGEVATAGHKDPLATHCPARRQKCLIKL
jgi:hypothetical protein